MKTRSLNLLVTLAFLVFSGLAAAHPCVRDPDNPKHKHCANNDETVKVFAAKVYFDNLIGDNITGDGNYYAAEMPVEGSPPGQFVMTLKLRQSRFLFFDFGNRVDCDGIGPDDQACVYDSGDDDRFIQPVPCLFPYDNKDGDGRCSGHKRVVMGFRHAFVPDNGDQNVLINRYMLGMPNGIPANGIAYDGEGDNIEIDFREENRGDDDLRLRFDANCLGQKGRGEFLKITAWNNVENDNIPNDEWQINTGTFGKKACLTRKGNGHREYLVGVFDMDFGYTICILNATGEANQNCPQL